MPVVADPGWATRDTYVSNHPSRILLAPGAELVSVGETVTDADIQAILPSSYP